MANTHAAHLNGSAGGTAYVNGSRDSQDAVPPSQTALGVIAAPAGTTHYYYYQQANNSPQIRYPSMHHVAAYGHPMALQVGHAQGDLNNPHNVVGGANSGGGQPMGGGGGQPPPGGSAGNGPGGQGGAGPMQQSQELSKTNLYIKGLTQNTTDKDLFELCAPFGSIVSTKAILDKDTQKCKGYGFVDFSTASEAENAVKALLGQGIQAQMARVSPSQSVNSQSEPDPTNLYIANLPAHMSETDLENLLSAHGSVISTRILRDSNNASRGVGFARMESKEKCEQIIHLYNGKKLAGSNEGLLVKFADGGNKKRLQQQQAQQQAALQQQGGGAYSQQHHHHHHAGALGGGPPHHQMATGQMGPGGAPHPHAAASHHNGNAQPHEVKVRSSPSGGHHGHHLGQHNGGPSSVGQGDHQSRGGQWTSRSAAEVADANAAALYGAADASAAALVSQHSPIGIVPTGFMSQGRATYGTPHPQLAGGGTLQLGGALQYAMQAANGLYGAYMTAGQQQAPAPAQYIIHSAGPAAHAGHPHAAQHAPTPHTGFAPTTTTLDGATLYAAHVGALGPAHLAQQMQQLQISTPHAAAATAATGHHLVQHYNTPTGVSAATAGVKWTATATAATSAAAATTAANDEKSATPTTTGTTVTTVE